VPKKNHKQKIDIPSFPTTSHLHKSETNESNYNVLVLLPKKK